MPANRWKVGFRKQGLGYWEGPLVAKWELDGEWLTDNFTPDEADAETLFRRWAKGATEEYPSGMVPIRWYVSCAEQAKLEGMPFQYSEMPEVDKENFLTFYEWPVHAVTGEPLNWFALPVADKQWNRKCGDKGGFIQEFTGWKPSILQPYVYLPALVQATLERPPRSRR